jgi:hypothetical protein
MGLSEKASNERASAPTTARNPAAQFFRSTCCSCPPGRSDIVLTKLGHHQQNVDGPHGFLPTPSPVLFALFPWVSNWRTFELLDDHGWIWHLASTSSRLEPCLSAPPAAPASISWRPPLPLLVAMIPFCDKQTSSGPEAVSWLVLEPPGAAGSVGHEALHLA